MHFIAILGLFSAISAAGSATVGFEPTDQVPLLGPSFLSNFDPTNTDAIRNATEAFPCVIDALFENGVLNKTDLTFAIDVFSAATNKSVYNYYHVGEGQNKTLTAGVLNDKTISRIGSVSKLFTVYAIIAKAGIDVFSHPVTRYIPELARNSSGDSLEHINWDDITVGALASHQAGSGGPTELIIWLVLSGEAQPEDLINITPEQLFKYMRDVKHPVTSPFQGAIYSDAGFLVLGQILARISGQQYKDAVRDILFEPLALDGMSATMPNGSDINAIDRRPVDPDTTFDDDTAVLTPSGGLFANGADLRAAGLSILNSELLSPSVTRQWMKPLAGTGSLVELVGAPWEIHRLAVPTTPGSSRTRISDLYTKSGGNVDYTCIFGLSPDHGLGFSILVGGSTASSARWEIRNALGELFIPAAEAAAADNAQNNLAGTFIDQTTPGTNLTLSVDDDLPGLGLKAFYIGGVESFQNLTGTTKKASLRLFPTGLTSHPQSLASLYKADGTIKVAHRTIKGFIPLKPRAKSEGGKGGLFDNQQVWQNIDFTDRFDEFIFTLDQGKLISVESTGANKTFTRVE
ncbi:hypothetical protein JX265_009440 [Neoarthrinium moseri]|uniref:Beta-lactamase-related domain-containing protein n=1 Tax=Neoarthrinium moseri TaxID=1658444 RepID=A0A9Q0AMT3_9PEZI|nr:uncharacterized protein JN550_010256 [Neoarthrinium moseri]KAI1841831.1 hypothetical protein JX266_012008 [Neoarthrinium moseri]KAI1861937.1 hypothetical protein JX265_009440 [Neoarthrinium moseri]KAI1862394.1 hypothetical protein JN550_010256 [Neoarthrinium moseri]